MIKLIRYLGSAGWTDGLRVRLEQETQEKMISVTQGKMVCILLALGSGTWKEGTSEKRR